MLVKIPALRWPASLQGQQWRDTRTNLLAWMEERTGVEGLEDVPSPVLSELLLEAPMFKTWLAHYGLFIYPTYAPRYLTRLFQASSKKFFAALWVGPHGRKRGTNEVEPAAIGCALDNLMGAACHVEYSMSCFTLDLTLKLMRQSAKTEEMLLVQIDIVGAKGRVMEVSSRVFNSQNEVVMEALGNFFRTDIPAVDAKHTFPMNREAEDEITEVPDAYPVSTFFPQPSAFRELRESALKEGFQAVPPGARAHEEAWDFGLGKRVDFESFFNSQSKPETLRSIVHFTEYTAGAPGRISGGCTLTVLAEAAKDFMRAYSGYSGNSPQLGLEEMKIIFKQPIWIRTVSLLEVQPIDRQEDGSIVLRVKALACKDPDQKGWFDEEHFLAATATVRCRVENSTSKL